MKLKSTIFCVLFCVGGIATTFAQNGLEKGFQSLTTHFKKQFPEADISDKLFLVTFWHSENSDSRSQNHDLIEAWNIYKTALLKNGKKGVVMYAVSADTDKIKWDIANQKDGTRKVFSVMDPAIIKELQIENIPKNVLYDSNGKVIAVDMQTPEVISKVFNQQITRE